MQFELNEAISILEKTPLVIRTFLSGLQDNWIFNNEGTNTWSPYDIVGHLIHGERTDWITRINKILSEDMDKKFEPFDRFAQNEESKGKTLSWLIDKFEELRNSNIKKLQSLDIENNYKKEGSHPEFGTVNLKQLLSTWVVHDLGHIAQISRVMSKQYKYEVGPWIKYLRILN